jgi:hypothetical protein
MVLMGATVLHSTRTTQWGPINAARQPGLPSTAIIRKIADLENAIAAVLAFIEEREGSRSPDCPGGQLLWAKRGDHFARNIPRACRALGWDHTHKDVRAFAPAGVIELAR